MNKRAYALDALRGYAIITMVLSATVAGILYPDGCITHKLLLRTELSMPVYRESPGWILFFHSSCLQWVLLSLSRSKKRFEKGDTKLRLVYEAIKRGVQLTFFAIFIQHFYRMF